VKYMFSTQQNETVGDELIFMIVPHIVRGLSVNAGTAREIDTGSGDAIRLERIAPSPAVTSVKKP
jgi:general secretion pathway protein D